jgi:apolipoprotein N-acyltransferase
LSHADVAAKLRQAPWWALALIALTSSLCMGLATPPSGPAWLVWLGWIPLVLVLRVSTHRRARSLFALGIIGGLCTGLVGFPWIAETLVRFGDFPVPLAYFGLVVFATWTAVPFGVWAIGVAKGPQRGWAAYVWPMALWVCANDLWPALFPYTPMIGLAQQAEWIQAAEIGGVPLVEAQTIAVGILVADAILDRERRWLRVGIAIAIPVLSFLLGSWRIATVDAHAAQARVVRFGVLQPNTALFAERRGDKMMRLWKHSALAQREGAQVIVWPEAGIYPWVVERPWTRDFSGPRQVLAAHRLPTILGVATRAPGDPYEWNTVVIMNADGEVTGSFDKTVLVPFGEYVPIVDPTWAQSYIPAMSHNYAGEAPARFEVDLVGDGETFHAGPLICYEDIFPGFARDVAVQDGGIEVFVNVTIDTWFGDTAEPWEHLALAQFRSVEHRIPMVRSVAAGTSSVVDTAGRVAAALPVRAPTREQSVEAERLVVDVALPRNTAESPTIFSRVGWLLQWLCIAIGLLAPLVAFGRRRFASRSLYSPEPSDR